MFLTPKDLWENARDNDDCFRKTSHASSVIYLKYCVILLVIKEKNTKKIVNKRYSFENNSKCHDKNQ